MEEVIRNRSIKINSSRLLHELETFSWVNGRPEALKGYHDDLVISLAIASWIHGVSLAVNRREVNYTKAILSNILRSQTVLGTKIKGQYGHDTRKDFDPIEHDMKESMARYAWLYRS